MQQPSKPTQPKPATAPSLPPHQAERAKSAARNCGGGCPPEYFEEAAGIGKSTAKIAAEMGLTEENAGKKIDGILYDKVYPELNQAWKRGKAMRAQSTPPVDSVVESEKKSAAPIEKEFAATDFIIPENLPTNRNRRFNCRRFFPKR